MKTPFVLLIGLMTCSIAHSQTAGNWPLNSSLNGAAGTSLSVSAVSLGSTITTSAFNSGSEWYGEGSWPSAATIDPNAYVEFTLTANTGHYLVLNTVTLIQRRSNTGTPQGSGPTSFSLRSSLDNYTTDITTGSMTYNYATYTISLPSAFQSIASKVTFRIYGYNATVSSGGASRFVFDNISVQGQSVSGVLAAQSISLAAHMDENKEVILQWDAVGFTTSAQFSLQRSSDGANFAAIFLTTGEEQFTDAALPVAATLYYRIAATLPDGSSDFSPVVAIKQEGKGNTAIKAIISQGGVVRTQLHLEETGIYQVSIWSQDGKPLARQTINGHQGDTTSDISFSAYSHGVYIMTLSKEGRIASRQFLF